jgi:hypothetical protein
MKPALIALAGATASKPARSATVAGQELPQQRAVLSAQRVLQASLRIRKPLNVLIVPQERIQTAPSHSFAGIVDGEPSLQLERRVVKTVQSDTRPTTPQQHARPVLPESIRASSTTLAGTAIGVSHPQMPVKHAPNVRPAGIAL